MNLTTHSHIRKATQGARRVHAAYMTQRQITRVITHQRGSWRWQDAFALAVYTIAKNRRTGGYYWRNVRTAGKVSKPQLIRSGLWTQYGHGGLHQHAALGQHLAPRGQEAQS